MFFQYSAEYNLVLLGYARQKVKLGNKGIKANELV